ncbi:hypothetical protein SERP0082 [Staphylococcus epidermidis RP62A]|uniref:Uncharacterized protein n=1 Tax=Staphylococcus epidermidis (strain ATCC 35984 / DSM 28319 / BCRC 17069 / CCUG 31568 / BM 3577 / RP62A) TaxID=176279 RepID=Q5HRW0_STAEQ|nr:hypothetical protein SERP0082 [Staphylococcus epidermidis RP62A]
MNFLTMSTIVLTTSMIVDTMLMFMTSFQKGNVFRDGC